MDFEIELSLEDIEASTLEAYNKVNEPAYKLSNLPSLFSSWEDDESEDEIQLYSSKEFYNSSGSNYSPIYQLHGNTSCPELNRKENSDATENIPETRSFSNTSFQKISQAKNFPKKVAFSEQLSSSKNFTRSEWEVFRTFEVDYKYGSWPPNYTAGEDKSKRNCGPEGDTSSACVEPNEDNSYGGNSQLSSAENEEKMDFVMSQKAIEYLQVKLGKTQASLFRERAYHKCLVEKLFIKDYRLENMEEKTKNMANQIRFLEAIEKKNSLLEGLYAKLRQDHKVVCDENAYLQDENQILNNEIMEREKELKELQKQNLTLCLKKKILEQQLTFSNHNDNKNIPENDNYSSNINDTVNNENKPCNNKNNKRNMKLETFHQEILFRNKN